MSLNIAPVYAKQYIRYSSTWGAATDNQAGAVGVVEIPEFAVVAAATYAGANKVCVPGNLTSFTGAIEGVNQSYIPTALSQPRTARQASVASSGSLIVEVSASAVAAFTINSRLSVGPDGKALPVANSGVNVTLDGTTPIIREIVSVGGRTVLIVSFS
jgi:hypothetical protein